MTPPIDTLRTNETPEGVALDLRVAGPAARAVALLVDSVIRFGLYAILLPVAGLSGLGMGLMLLGFFLLEWFYPVVFEVWTGATPGKRSMGLAVVHDDGTPVTLRASMIRNLLRVVDFLPLFYGVGLVSTLVDRDFRRLGDLAAGTLVIYTDAALPEREMPKAAPTMPPRGLALPAQQAILAFAERAGRLSVERREELARGLLARLGEAPAGEPGGAGASERVMGYASWLARGR